MGSKTRWDHIPSGNKIQADFEQGIWTWWMGVGAARRNNRYGEEHHQRICACCPWKVSISCKRRARLFLSRRHSNRHLRLQIECINALLQRSRRCQRAVGSPIQSEVYDGLRKANMG